LYNYHVQHLLFLGFTSPEDVQVFNSPSGNTPHRRRSADTSSNLRRKLSVDKEPKDSLSSINELNTKNKKSDIGTSSTTSRTNGTSSSSSSISSSSSSKRDIEKSTSYKRDTEKITSSKIDSDKSTSKKDAVESTKTDSPQIEITRPTKKYTIDTKLSTKTPPSSTTTTITAQDRVTTKSPSLGRQEGSTNIIGIKKSLVNGDMKATTDKEEAKPVTAKTTSKFSQQTTAKEPVVTSKPPTAQQTRQEINKDKSNSLKKNFDNKEDKGPAVSVVKETSKDQAPSSPATRRISQYRLSGSEALHIFHPTRRNATPKSGDYNDTNSEIKEDEERSRSPNLPRSPVPDKRGSSLKRGSQLTISTTDDTSQPQTSPTPPRSPKSPIPTSVTGTRRPGVVESKTKKMLALMGKEVSVDLDRPADIPRSTPVS